PAPAPPPLAGAGPRRPPPPGGGRPQRPGRHPRRGPWLRRGALGPMSLLVRDGATIRLQDHWPTEDDLGVLVILPGGEAGILTGWRHAPARRSSATQRAHSA